MKFSILLLVIGLGISSCASAQFFGPKPTPYQSGSLKLGAPIIGVSASVSTGTSFLGGFGVSFQHDKADAASNTYVPQYTISAVGFIGTNGTKITGTAGLIVGIPGTSGIVQVGPGYDFTQKQLVLLTGVSIPIF